MEEIKLRAWCGDRNAMYQNVGYKKHINGFSVLPYDSITGDELGWMYSKSHKLDTMQYTGLKDKNGIEIYEGDIVTTSIETVWDVGEVIFRNTAFRVHGYILCQLKDIEVIGNRYENPELNLT